MAQSPSQQFVPIEDIRDGMVILKAGGMRGLLMVSAVNLALKSADEQEATIFQFQNFLNTLDFPVQIVVQSRKMDIRPYLQTLEDRLLQQKEELLRVQTKMYIKYIKTFTEQVDIMKKYFYVVVPYDAGISLKGSKNPLSGILPGGKKKKKTAEEQANESFEEKRSQLLQRMSVVQQGLSASGLQVSPLDTQQTIEVFYNLYNPGDSQGSIVESLEGAYF